MFGFFYDSYYWILVVPAMLLAAFAQMKVSSTFNRYSQVRSRSGYTGAQAARDILDRNGLQGVRIERVRGNLTDHYDPRSNVVRLSDSVYDSPSVAAIGVAAHECGHAVQHAVGYFPIKLRSAIIPVTNIGSKLSIPLLLIGLVVQVEPLINLGILLFSTMALFQLVTLPVEYNASNRALATLDSTGMLSGDELQGSKKVLSAAALTYVAALLVAVMQLLRLLLLFGGRRRDD
ncbi:zinc metallopeptidase [Clostridiaceae bacterium NSJ-31]|uniref:Zinc metallopeptidase n=1 Tax=Ligaoa zhengdingensis TaxID=2763658 RepID=A0A926E1S2_9FIRM|nr:zinc metallopeptidase [Ligaoa zhengdingensis]MBC8547539.1 zinc metallopeptidase [Ligaoa zhengdingensis]